jgi:hypothetical protein
VQLIVVAVTVLLQPHQLGAVCRSTPGLWQQGKQAAAVSLALALRQGQRQQQQQQQQQQWRRSSTRLLPHCLKTLCNSLTWSLMQQQWPTVLQRARQGQQQLLVLLPL